jgi:hypothetical protein
MSVQAMSWVIDHSTHSETSFIVLLMIANHARSDGTLAWPSIPVLAKESRCSEKTVQRAIKALCTSGELKIDQEYGPKKSRIYSLPMLPKGPKTTPDEGGHFVHSEGTQCPPRVDICDLQGGHLRPANKEEPSLKQPSLNRPIQTLPEWLPIEQWNGFIQMRKQMPKVPFGERAQKLAISELEKLRAQGQDPGAVLDQSTMKGWRGLFPISNGNGAHHGNKPETFGQISVGNSRRAAEASLAHSGLFAEPSFAFDVQPRTNGTGLRSLAKDPRALPDKFD